MSTTKNCKNCGADNDPLITNCAFCKTSLPQIDLDSISNEDLIQNAGEWIGKVGHNSIKQTENFNAWTGKGQIMISANEIEGMASKYLGLLQVRSLNNQSLRLVYEDLKKELDYKRSSFLYKLGGGNKQMGIAVAYFLLLAVVGILLAIIL